MELTREIPPGKPFDLSSHVVGMNIKTGRACFVEPSPGPPNRIEGFTVGAQAVGNSPHAGEMHPDADELLYLVSGRIQVRLELEGGDQEVEVGPGQALVVPRGVWHLISLKEPGQLVNITPGPGGQHRPLAAARDTPTAGS
jgi:mannose-6-phosphate isomerase-like protein (cupin superfamily)